jgi:hypothetical protein
LTSSWKTIVVAVLITCGFIIRYYAVTLPDLERERIEAETKVAADRLEWEKQIKADETAKREADKEQQDAQLSSCLVSSEKEFNESWKLNSTPIQGQPGVRTGNRDILARLNREKAERDHNCHEQNPQGTF